MVDADAADGVEGDAREREAFLKIARPVHAYDADAARLLERWRARLERDDLPKRYDGALDGARRDVRTLGAKAKALNYDFLRCALHTFVDNERAPAHLRIPNTGEHIA